MGNQINLVRNLRMKERDSYQIWLTNYRRKAPNAVVY
jgi:hypothetical protein